MLNALEIAAIYDEWERKLAPEEKEWCRRALQNARELGSVGTVSAKELLVKVLLYCQGKFPWE